MTDLAAREGSRGEMAAIPAGAERVVSAYLHLADRILPGRLAGLYLVGSIALGDFRPGASDVDFVAVIDAPLNESELSRLRRLHLRLRLTLPRPALDGIYVTWDQLARSPEGASCSHVLGGRFRDANAFAANPVTWSVLRRHPFPVRGPHTPAVLDDDAELREWCRRNLAGYWAAWAAAARGRLHRRAITLVRRATTWGVLGVTRLHATIREGEILSKSAAGAYALRIFPSRWAPVIEDALGDRSGTGRASFRSPLARRREALLFVEHVVEDAGRAS